METLLFGIMRLIADGFPILLVVEIIALARNEWKVPDRSFLARGVYNSHHNACLGQLSWCKMFWMMVLTTFALMVFSLLGFGVVVGYIDGLISLITGDTFAVDGRTKASVIVFAVFTTFAAIILGVGFVVYLSDLYASREIDHSKPQSKFGKGVQELKQVWNDKFCPTIRG